MSRHDVEVAGFKGHTKLAMGEPEMDMDIEVG